MAEYGKLLTERRSPWSHHRKKISPKVRRTVYERDGWACQRCGLVFEERPPNPKHAPYTRLPCGRGVWLEMHHIIAYSKGGSDVVPNLQSLCSPCNNKVGAR